MHVCMCLCTCLCAVCMYTCLCAVCFCSLRVMYSHVSYMCVYVLCLYMWVACPYWRVCGLIVFIARPSCWSSLYVQLNTIQLNSLLRFIQLLSLVQSLGVVLACTAVSQRACVCMCVYVCVCVCIIVTCLACWLVRDDRNTDCGQTCWLFFYMRHVMMNVWYLSVIGELWMCACNEWNVCV